MTSGISASQSQLLITCSIHTPPPSSSSLSLPPFSWMADDCRMARDETAVSALSFEKRTQLLNSKFAILNRCEFNAIDLNHNGKSIAESLFDFSVTK